ncbi:helix-turn-helix domain-containing protein [Sorangium sp. So ce861]|uniref:helix-turn-helix domain-containing protein n=1 Tax=Sorangium sp. So ce861 TaxID=3133323 RepID=UPI003F635B10
MERIEPLEDLGKALAQLRSLQGLSLEECARRIGIPAQNLASAEAGQIDDDTMQGIAKLYALEEDDLREGWVRPREGVEGATVFLLHGAYQEFDAKDLGVLDRAMRAARSMSVLLALLDGGEALRRRMQFVPVLPAGPWPGDAARQGHKLARWVRAKLGLGGEPVADIRALLEEQFGIAVVVDDLVSEDLRAASILDARRAAAAAVLASAHPDLESNPTLARVFLAHELCHLLFDPGAPGSVRIALDDRLDDRAAHGCAGLDANALLERRAKGFAAEFLIPLDGVKALLGPAAAPVSLDEARTMVAKIREHFETSWDIATFHLHNLGYIQKELKFALRGHKPAAPVRRFATSLPSAGATPRGLEALLASQTEARIEAEDLSSTAVGMASTPWYVEAARRASLEVLDDMSSRVIDGALRALSQGREIEAGHVLIEHLDDLFLAGEFPVAGRMLSMLDPRRLSPKVLSAVLMETKHAKDELGHARVEFFERARAALLETWDLRPEQVESICRRHA